MPERELLTPTEAAALMGVSRSSMYRLLSDGAIPAVRVPGMTTLRISRRWLLEYVDRLSEAAEAEREAKLGRLEAEAAALDAVIVRLDPGPHGGQFRKRRAG